MRPETRLQEHLDELPGVLGVALSGGSDSTALLVLAAEYCTTTGRSLFACTVDHGLRAAAREEALAAKQLCTTLNVPHITVSVSSLSDGGDLQARARRARYDALQHWAAQMQIDWVLLGHTHDDAAETFLMRLARGSGVDGLSGMPRQWHRGATGWARPLLDAKRTTLQASLRERGVTWSEDPSNADSRFARVQFRKAMPDLAGLGLTADTLVQTAQRMQDAQEVLEQAALSFEQQHTRLEYGDVCLTAAALYALPKDTLGRVFAHALQWVSGAVYRPRYSALQAAIAAAQAGKAHTLHGCLIYPAGAELRITREAASALAVPAGDGTWDGRWTLSGPFEPGDEIGCLGQAGLQSLGGKPEAPLVPYRSLVSSPAVRRGGIVVCAPIAGCGNGWIANVTRKWRGA